MDDIIEVYSRVNWKNEPSMETPLSAGNLNRGDEALKTIDTRVVTLFKTKLDKTTAYEMVKNITYDEATGIFTIEYLNGTTATLDTKLEKLAVNFRYDPETEKLIITLEDGTEQEVDLSALITEYDFENTDTVAFTVENGVVKAMIPDGAITGDKLEPNYLANCESAKVTAEAKALVAEGYSLGTQNKQPVGPDSEYYQNNAKYYKEQARQIVGDVSLESLTDVSLTDVQDGDVLVWNADTEKWVNGQGTPTPKEIEITFTVEGAKADNIAIHDSNGAIVGNVIFGAEETSKEVTLTIPEEGGNYTFESSVAKATDGSGGNYTKNVTLTKSSIVSRLPDGYAELEYIESTGTQYIDTLYDNTLGWGIESELAFTEAFPPEGQNSMDYCGRNGSSGECLVSFRTTKLSTYNNGVRREATINIPTRKKINVKSFLFTDKILFSAAGQDYINETHSTGDRLSGNVPFLATYLVNNNVGVCTKAKIYSAKMYANDGTTLVRNFIPCRRLSDNAVGMYDLVTNAFFGNSGTGTFVGGKRVDIPLVKVMPDGALYWYGNECGGWNTPTIQHVDSLVADTVYPTSISYNRDKETNALYIRANQNIGGQTVLSFYTSISTVGKQKMYAETVDATNGALSLMTSLPNGIDIVSSSSSKLKGFSLTKNGISEFDITPYQVEGYVSYYIAWWSNNGTYTCRLKRVWLE